MILPLRFRVIVLISIFLIIMAIVLMNRDSKSKTEYGKITSSVTYVGKKFGDLPNRDFGKYRYITLKDYPFPFEIYVGKESGDLKAKSENIDSIKIR
jgi:hypothetical protein